jgi:pyocin large subunit-like protein
MRRWLALGLAAALLSGPISGLRAGDAPPASRPAPAAAKARFSSERKLQDHFRRHGRRLGCASAAQYLERARALVSGGPGVETHLRKDGDTLFYRASTNEFAVLSAAGIIRTYFSPDSGVKYWRRQLAKDR